VKINYEAPPYGIFSILLSFPNIFLSALFSNTLNLWRLGVMCCEAIKFDRYVSNYTASHSWRQYVHIIRPGRQRSHHESMFFSQTETNFRNHIKQRVQLQLYVFNKKFWQELIVYFSRYDTGHIENDASNNYSLVACVFVTAVTFQPSRCLATIGGIHRHTRTATWSHKATLLFKIRKVG
jgi:hypothetical protein